MVLSLAVIGCSTHDNPSFPLSVDDAKSALGEMKGDPKPLTRPILVLGGWIDPGFAKSKLIKRFRDYTNDERIVGVSFGSCNTFDDCRDKVLEELEAAFPSDDPQWTIEVDVIAFSMGGLVARHAYRQPPPDEPRRRLRVARLFSISAPHRGATLATMPTLNQLQVDMRPGSEFLFKLNQEQEEFEYSIYSYVRLGDSVIGVVNAAPPGQTPWWLSNLPLQTAHTSAYTDLRIHADIVRRLRDEAPFATEPAAPLPE